MRRLDTEATGRNIKKMMEERGLQIKDIQTACGFSTEQAIYKWFRGDTMPAIDNLVIVSDLFKCTMDDIIVTI